MITASLNDTHQHLDTLARAKDRPHVLDDEIIDRVEQALSSTQQTGTLSRFKPAAKNARKRHFSTLQTGG